MQNTTPVQPVSADEEEQRKLQQAAMSKYNKPLEQLTPQERDDLFRSYQSQRDQAQSLIDTPAAQGKMMGNVYAGPTFSASLSSAVKQGLGHAQMGRANKAERRGRETAAGLAATQSDQAEARRQEQLKREDERFQQMLGMFGTGR